MPNIVVVGSERIVLDFLNGAKGVDPQLTKLVRHHGHLLRTRVMRRASRRPGPNVVTGDYRRTIGVRFTNNRGEHVAEVGTNAPQGRRLEFGFHGVDAIGRHYNQPPYPHFGPAMDETRPGFLAGIEGILEGI